MEKIEFHDFNINKIKDILIQNISEDQLTGIKGFNEIKNPHYLPKYNLIDNEVMSGQNWTSFYKIKKDTIFDFGYSFHRSEDENIINFEKEYEKMLSKVIKNKSNK